MSMNHILPREYLDVLVVLQDRALSHTPQEVAGEREREIQIGRQRERGETGRDGEHKGSV